MKIKSQKENEETKGSKMKFLRELGKLTIFTIKAFIISGLSTFFLSIFFYENVVNAINFFKNLF